MLAYEMVKVPAGTFTLSIPINDSVKITYIDKKIVIKKPYYMGKYEVTNKLWDQCVKAGICRRRNNTNLSPDHPVTKISWQDAYGFTQWYSKKTKQNYRLPTEEEWAYAMNMGKNYRESEVVYDYDKIDLKKLPQKKTLKKGSINKNLWGIHDYFGNVWEWTLTCWYGAKENILKEITTEELNHPKKCTTRVAQGETRSHIPDFIYDTYNGGCSTLRPAANLGFRMVRDITKQEKPKKIPVIGQEKIRGDFLLLDSNAKPFGSEQLKGKKYMLFFGFTRCPSACPLGVSKMMSVYRGMRKQKKNIIPIFVTIDPEGDSFKRLKKFKEKYGQNLVTLKGNKEQTQNIVNKFRGYFHQQSKNSFDHSSLIYFMGKNGEYITHFTSQQRTKDLIDILKRNY